MASLSYLAKDSTEEVYATELCAVGVRNEIDLLVKGELVSFARRADVPLSVLERWKHQTEEKYAQNFISLSEQVELTGTTHYSTGCEAVDRFLGGGFRNGDINQVTGDEGSGKTQLCYTVAVIQLLKGNRVLYLDTEAAFCAERVTSLMRHRTGRSVNLKPLMDLMHVVSVIELHELFALMHDLMKQQTLEYEVLILDSILSVLSAHFIELDNSGETELQFEMLNELIFYLNSLLQKNPALAIIVTNGKLKWFKRMWRNACSLTLHLSSDGQIDPEDDTSLDPMSPDTSVEQSEEPIQIRTVRQLQVMHWIYLRRESDPRFQIEIRDSGVGDFVSE